MKKISYYLFEDQRKLIIFTAMAIMVSFYSVFFFFPLTRGILGSFYEWNPLTGVKEFIGLENYQVLFKSPIFWLSLRNTITFTAVAVIGRTTLGIAIACGLHSVIKGKEQLRSAYFLPVIMPIVAVSIVWKWIYHPRIGLLNMILAAFGFGGQNWLGDAALALPGVLAMTIWKDVGYAVIIFMAALLNVPKNLYEAASIDGAGRWASFRHITIPMLKPTVVFITITSLIGYFQSFVQIFIMTKGGPGTSTYVISYLIYNEAFTKYNFGYASAISVVLFVIILIITLMQHKFLTGGDE